MHFSPLYCPTVDQTNLVSLLKNYNHTSDGLPVTTLTHPLPTCLYFAQHRQNEILKLRFDHVTPLLKILWWFHINLRLRTKHFSMAYKTSNFLDYLGSFFFHSSPYRLQVSCLCIFLSISQTWIQLPTIGSLHYFFGPLCSSPSSLLSLSPTHLPHFNSKSFSWYRFK